MLVVADWVRMAIAQFVVIPDAIDATLLREIQEAWTRVVQPIQRQWEEDIKQGEGIDGLFFKKPPASSIAAPTTRGSVLYRTFCEICNGLTLHGAESRWFIQKGIGCRCS